MRGEGRKHEAGVSTRTLAEEGVAFLGSPGAVNPILHCRGQQAPEREAWPWALGALGLQLPNTLRRVWASLLKDRLPRGDTLPLTAAPRPPICMPSKAGAGGRGCREVRPAGGEAGAQGDPRCSRWWDMR